MLNSINTTSNLNINIVEISILNIKTLSSSTLDIYISNIMKTIDKINFNISISSTNTLNTNNLDLNTSSTRNLDISIFST